MRYEEYASLSPAQRFEFDFLHKKLERVVFAMGGSFVFWTLALLSMYQTLQLTQSSSAKTNLMLMLLIGAVVLVLAFIGLIVHMKQLNDFYVREGIYVRGGLL